MVVLTNYFTMATFTGIREATLTWFNNAFLPQSEIKSRAEDVSLRDAVLNDMGKVYKAHLGPMQFLDAALGEASSKERIDFCDAIDGLLPTTTVLSGGVG